MWLIITPKTTQRRKERAGEWDIAPRGFNALSRVRTSPDVGDGFILPSFLLVLLEIKNDEGASQGIITTSSFKFQNTDITIIFKILIAVLEVKEDKWVSQGIDNTSRFKFRIRDIAIICGTLITVFLPHIYSIPKWLV